jgi:hypothetical protein
LWPFAGKGLLDEAIATPGPDASRPRAGVWSRQVCSARSACLTGWVVLVGALAAPSSLQAQAGGLGPGAAGLPINPETAPRPTLRALRMVSIPVEGEMKIDAVLDEPWWDHAQEATDFTTTLPRAGYPASERTVVKVMYDVDHVYVGAVMYDSEPERLTSPGLEQDFSTHDADIFMVAFDTYLDRQTAVMWGVSPAGALFDGQMFNDSRITAREWEGIVYHDVRILEDRWVVEMAIPLTTLRFRETEGEQTWGANFGRRIRRINEDSYWSPLDSRFRIHKVSRAGTIDGFQGLRQGRNLTIKPYVLGEHLQGAAREALDDTGGNFAAGLDLKYGITPRLTLDASLFTDFSQVEVDQEQVNLTRFSVFFPEKRDFFLENQGIFSLGDVAERNYRTGSSPSDFNLFYSRNIGLSPDRRVIPMVGGIRLSGRMGQTDVGFLTMQTMEFDEYAPENFLVARVRQPVAGDGDVGFMFINRQATSGSDRYNRSFGVDANARLFDYLILNAYAAATDGPLLDGDRTSLWFQAAYRDRIWDTSAFVKHVGDDFNPEVGFIRRRDINQVFATFGAHPQPDLPGIQELNPYVDVSFIENLRGVLESRWVKGGFASHFLDGGQLTLEVNDQFERLLTETLILGRTVPAGSYDFTDGTVSYTASGARKLSGSLALSRGGFYDGDRTSVAVSGLLRPNPHWSFEVFGEHNAITLTGEAFTADVYGGRIKYAHNTRIFTSAFVQWVEQTDELITNLRLNFIHSPLSDLFLVYTERRNLGLDQVVDRVVTLKVTKLFQF